MLPSEDFKYFVAENVGVLPETVSAEAILELLAKVNNPDKKHAAKIPVKTNNNDFFIIAYFGS